MAYCKDGRRRGVHDVISFTFLGYTFRPRKALRKDRKGSFTGFQPGVSAEKLTEMSRRAQAWKLSRRTTLTLAELARAVNPVLAGWLAYFTRFYPTAVIPLCKRIDRHLIRWAKRKYKRLERGDKRAWAWLAAVTERCSGSARPDQPGTQPPHSPAVPCAPAPDLGARVTSDTTASRNEYAALVPS